MQCLSVFASHCEMWYVKSEGQFREGGAKFACKEVGAKRLCIPHQPPPHQPPPPLLGLTTESYSVSGVISRSRINWEINRIGKTAGIFQNNQKNSYGRNFKPGIFKRGNGSCLWTIGIIWIYFLWTIEPAFYGPLTSIFIFSTSFYPISINIWQFYPIFACFCLFFRVR